MHDGVSKFIQTICYNGQDDESFVETKVRLYMRMKVKSSLTLPPDPKSTKQHILWVNFQLLDWLSFNEKAQQEKDLSNSGWVWDESRDQFIPIWFEGKPFYLVY